MTRTRHGLTGVRKAAIDLLQNKIDRMVDLFSRTHPEFVEGYKNARMIVDRAATRTTAKTAGNTTTPPSV